jgi:phosphate transport system permease protein
VKKNKKNYWLQSHTPAEKHLADRQFLFSLRAIAVLLILVFVLIFVFLFMASWPAFKKEGLMYMLDSKWSPNTESYGVMAFIYGTLVSSLLALLMAVPISVATALFLTELCPRWLSAPFRSLLELLAAIPSVVYGLWGIFILAPAIKSWIQPFLKSHFGFLPLFQGPPFGIGLFSAGIILAIMITPTITSICVEVFKSIPDLYREGARALGATLWETMQMAVLRPGAAGVVAATILGLGRAMGETMAVTMLIGNRAEISASLFSPAATMASVIANEYNEASSSLHVSALTGVGFTLLIISVLVNGSARFIVWRIGKRY